MSTLLLAKDSARESQRACADEPQVDVNIDDLIVGRPLTNPVFDDDGLLLLAEGATITADFRRLLKQRGMTSVKIHSDDVDRVRLHVDVTASIADMGDLTLDSALTQQLERVIDSGLMIIRNNGPAMRDSVVPRGRTDYNDGQSAELKVQCNATCASLGNLMKDAVHGKNVSSTEVTTLAAQHLSSMIGDTDCMIATAMEASRDAGLAQHCLKMATLGMAIGIEMGLDEDHCKRICVAGLVHDWGMAKVSAEIRNSPRRLSELKFFQIKKHPVYVAEMLERMPGIPSMVPVIVSQVHERPNGKGYPRGRSGERVHLFSRILAVADTYAALTEARPYRAPLTPYAAMECLVKLAKTRDVDPEVVRAFLKVMNLFPIGSLVALSDGSVAQVIRRNGEHYTKPVIRVIQDALGQTIPAGKDAAIIDLTQSERQVIQALPTPGLNEQLLSDDVLHPSRSQT